MSSSSYWGLVVAILLLLATPGLCQEPIEDLLQGETIPTQPRYGMQISYGTISFSRVGDLIHAPMTVEYGLTDRWQASFSPGRLLPRIGRSDQPVEFGLKRSYVDIRNSGTHMAWGVRALNNGRLMYCPFVAAAKNLARDRAQIVADIAYLGRAEAGSATTRADLGAWWQQGNIAFSEEITREGVTYWTQGVFWRLPKASAWILGFGVSTGFTHQAPLRAVVKLTRVFDRLPVSFWR